MASRKVVLVGWDAADWKVIDPLRRAGRMPNLQRLVENGAAGRIATLHPPLSPMLWTSIATGKRPFKHGIHGFAEPTPDGRDVQPVTNLSRRSKAVWNILSQNALRSIVIGWWPSHPAESIRGVMVSDHYHRAIGPVEDGWPMRAHTVHPDRLTETLAALRTHPDLLTPAMVEPFLPRAKEIDQERDQRLGTFLRILAECMCMQSAALWLIENEPWDFFTVYFDAIDHFSHAFMRYHPPRQSWIGERDFEIYRNVVSMAYQRHDEMLGALLAKSPDNATVIIMSDHGFHPDHLRPSSIPDIPAGPAIEHRDFGVFVMRGANIRHGTLHGVSVLDLAPTVLAMFGLPVGEDMDGKVLSQAFIEPPQTVFVPSWEQIRGEDGCHPPGMRVDPAAAQEALEQMIALGYIERPAEDRENAVRKTVQELRYNLGQAYQDADRHGEAYSIFKELCVAEPGERRFAVRLFTSCQALALTDEMRGIAASLDTGGPPGCRALDADYLAAQILIAEKRYEEALAALEHLSEQDAIRPRLLVEMAQLYLRLDRLRDARRIYEQALATDPDDIHAHIGLCRIALRRRRFSAAARAALETIERTDQHPQAHFLLGAAMAGMKHYERAAAAFRAAISFNPNFPEAHRRLAAVLEKHLGDADSAREHRGLARRMRSRTGSRTQAQSASEVKMESCMPASRTEMPPVSECLIVVTGLPRSGTSMLMQMLAAGGISVVTDELRHADEDNPRGYLEFEPVKKLHQDSAWLPELRGKAIKIVAPLLTALPPGLACRVILCERNLDEVLDSQDRMLARRNHPAPAAERRAMLKDEFARMIARTKAMLELRPQTRWLAVDHRAAMADPLKCAERVNELLDGGLDTAKMAAAIDPTLHRNRAAGI